ncbi:MAG: PH domain-containing protein [Candidatus Micrarchaeia archaeon]
MASIDPRMRFVWLAQAAIALAAFWLLAFILYILVSPGEILPGTPNRVLLFTLMIGSFVVVLGGMAAWAELSLRSFAWSLEEKELVIEKGLLAKQRLSLPYEKIKEIRVLRAGWHFIDQVFGLATLRIETGDRRLYAVIPGVAEPDELIRSILARSQGTPLKEAKEAKEDEDRRLLLEIREELKGIKGLLEKREREKPSFREALHEPESEFGFDELTRMLKEEHRKKKK